VPGGEDMAERCAPKSNPDVTHLNGRKDRELETSGYTVTSVTPSDAFSTQEMSFPGMAVPAPPMMDGATTHRCVAGRHFAVDPLCPKCRHDSCAAYGARGRVCMRCGYCERPDETLNDS
jgi:hypothetical protein